MYVIISDSIVLYKTLYGSLWPSLALSGRLWHSLAFSGSLWLSFSLAFLSLSGLLSGLSSSLWPICPYLPVYARLLPSLAVSCCLLLFTVRSLNTGHIISLDLQSSLKNPIFIVLEKYTTCYLLPLFHWHNESYCGGPFSYSLLSRFSL